MTTVYRLLLCLTIHFFLSGCTSKTERQENAYKDLRITKVDSVVLTASRPLFGMFYEHFEISKEGSKWVFVDRNTDRVFVYNSDGKFDKVIGERGKGPKGLMRVMAFDFNEKDDLVIFDVAQRKLKVFNLNGELLQSSNFLNDSPFSMSLFGMKSYQGKVLMTIVESEYVYEPHKSKQLAILEYSGEVDSIFGKFDPYAQEDNNYSFDSKLAIDDRNNEVFVSLTSSPYIQIYDLENYRQKEYFGEPTPVYQRPEKEISAYISIPEVIKRATGSTSIYQLYLTDQFLIQHMQVLTEKWFEEIDHSLKENILVIYDKEQRKFIKEISVPYTLGAVWNNKLYFIEDFNPDNYTIGIYELQY